jgi:hypothetical protein
MVRGGSSQESSKAVSNFPLFTTSYALKRPPSGGHVASGLYFYRLEADGIEQVRKMMLLR